MSAFSDNSGIFKDFGFKLVVINSLLDCPCSFSEKLEEMKEKYVDDYEGEDFECIPQMLEFFQEVVLTEQDLALVNSLVFDGGEDIYFLIMPNWDGESEEFDVESVEDMELLPNLREVEYTSMCDPDLMDQFTEKGITVS